MATTTTVVHTYIHLGRIHEVVEPDIPLAPAVIPEALLEQPLGPWDFPLSILLEIKMELVSPRLLSVEILPPLAIPIIKLSSTTTPIPMAASSPIPEYHLAASITYEE